MFPLSIGHACQMLVICRTIPSENTFHPIAIKIYSQYISQVKMKWRPPYMKYGKRVLLRLFAGKTGNFYADMIKDLWRRKKYLSLHLNSLMWGKWGLTAQVLSRCSILKCHKRFAVHGKILKNQYVGSEKKLFIKWFLRYLICYNMTVCMEIDDINKPTMTKDNMLEMKWTWMST